MAPSSLRKALSFRVRDDDEVRAYPPARGQQWPLQQCLVPELVEQLVEVLKGRYQDGIQQPTAERDVEVPIILCQEFFEALKGVSQELKVHKHCPLGTDSGEGLCTDWGPA